MKYPPHILIIRLSALGDVAMTVPVVKALAEQYPHLNITVLSQPFAAPLFEGISSRVHFMGADIKGEHKTLGGLGLLFRRLHAKHFMAVADMHDVLRTKYLRMRFVLNRYNTRHINKHRSLKRKLIRHTLPSTTTIPTTVQNYADVLARLGYPVSLPAPSLGNEYIKGAIGIAPFAAHKGKVYPTEKMERVVSMLSEKEEVTQIHFFSGKGKEREEVERLCRKYAKCSNASRQLGSLGKELELMSRLECMLSMDSGNAHLAAAVGTRVVTVWGATHPRAGFKAYTQRDEDIIDCRMDCRPCSIYGNRPCKRGDYACLYNIDERQIVDKLTEIINT